MTSVADVGVGFARRAEELHQGGDSDAALRLLTTGVRRHAGDVTALVVLARVCRESGREDEALDWAEAALRLDPECPAARALLAADDVFANRPEAPAPPPTNLAAPASAVFGDHARDDHRAPRPPADPASAPFSFPVREEDEEPEIDENSAPHVATVTLAEIYFQQGLKEQAAQIYRQLLERQPGDDAVRKRLEDILREPEGS